ncbi:sarcosine oxidase subunit gamma [Leisingera sp. M658]|uniref:sarcosine oxidase subunit gamma n=1 Tax=Leisingera sp. M658 TaxID=2867015 RepID=UPI0021A3FE6D|nr:sarcosine oxidase subunit gamma family protein [Leisingera sp. M658]UWQ75816.1 hypothetical protein K3724_04995 [Leisingera sp. M658]
MADPYSPLTSVMTPGSYGGQTNSTLVDLQEKPVGGLVQVAGWEGFDSLIGQVLGLAHPLSFHTAQEAKGCTIFKIAPARVMIQHDDPDQLARLTTSLSPEQAGVVALENARCRLHLSGAEVEAVLQRVAALDFSRAEFPVGEFRQSGIHHVAVMFHRTSDQGFDLFVPTTWAMSVFDYLRDAAWNFGLTISSPA